MEEIFGKEYMHSELLHLIGKKFPTAKLIELEKEDYYHVIHKLNQEKLNILESLIGEEDVTYFQYGDTVSAYTTTKGYFVVKYVDSDSGGYESAGYIVIFRNIDEFKACGNIINLGGLKCI